MRFFSRLLIKKPDNHKKVGSAVRFSVMLPLLLSYFVLVPGFAAAFEWTATEWEFGLRWIGNYEGDSEEGFTGSGEYGSANILTPAFTFRIPFEFSEGSSFSFVPSLSVSRLQYRWDETAERTLLTDIEWREGNSLVLRFDETVRWDMYTGTRTHFAVESGLSVELPVPVESTVSGEELGKVYSGYYGRGKFLLYSFSFFSYWPFTNAYDLSLRLETHLPVHHIWDNEEVPFYDHMGVSLSLGIRFPKEKRTIFEEPEPPKPKEAPPLPRE